MKDNTKVLKRLFLMCMYVCLCMCTCMQVPIEVRGRSPGSGVTGICELLDMGAGTQLSSLLE